MLPPDRAHEWDSHHGYCRLIKLRHIRPNLLDGFCDDWKRSRTLPFDGKNKAPQLNHRIHWRSLTDPGVRRREVKELCKTLRDPLQRDSFRGRLHP